MKLKISLLLLLTVGWGQACTKAEPRTPQRVEPEYDVFLLIGQSNMAGRGEMLPEDLDPIEGVWLLDDNDRPAPATNPLNRYSTVRKELSLQQISPGYSFSREIAARTGRKVLLVVNALGGSSIGQWSKNAALIQDEHSIGYNRRQLYEEILVRAKRARKYGTIKAILWHQGEANASEKLIPYYLPALKKFVEDLRTDLGMPTLPFIAGELGPWREQHVKFNEMLRLLPGSIPYSGYVSAEGCTANPDNLHFTREAQLLLGERYAERVLEMCY